MNEQTASAPPAPFSHEIRVTWGDCDPARIAYTGRIPLWALDAINAWWEHYMDGEGWYQLELDHNIGTPFVHMSLDFRAPITPRHRLMCKVWPMRLGTSSIRFAVTGSQDGVLSFEGQFVCVFTFADKFSVRPAPKNIRQIVEPLLHP